MECKLNPFLSLVDSYHLCLVIISFGLALSLKDKRWALVTGITACNYYMTFSTMCYFAYFDEAKIWRYFIWVGWEALCITIMYIALHKRLVFQRQAFAIMLIGFAGICLQIYRFIDRHYFDLAYSTSIYEAMGPTLNNLLTLVCLYPLITHIKKRFRKWQLQ